MTGLAFSGLMGTRLARAPPQLATLQTENESYKTGIREFTSRAEMLQETNNMMRQEMASLNEQMGAIEKLNTVNRKLQEKVTHLKAKLREADISTVSHIDKVSPYNDLAGAWLHPMFGRWTDAPRH